MAIVPGSLEFLNGAYQIEYADGEPFIWLADECEIRALEEDVYFLEGVPCKDMQVSITAGSESAYRLARDKKVALPIPALVMGKGGSININLKFSGYMRPEGDGRRLAFRLLDVWSLKNKKERSHYRGFPEGMIATIFSHGWLRASIARDGGKFRISGINIPPYKTGKNAVLMINGLEAANARYNLTNKDYPFAENCAFEGEFSLEKQALSEDGMLEISMKYDDGEVTPWYQKWHYPLMERLPVPDSENRERIGAENPDWFLFSGATFYRHVSHYLKRMCGNGLKDLSILDWGCGCGWAARYFLGRGFKNITGIDIDKTNIEWCADNLPGGTFLHIAPHEKTPFEDNAFDVVYGHSVMTHLSEKDQFFWMRELRRILKPGGWAILTVLGNYSLAIEKFPPAMVREIQEKGFYDCGPQNYGAGKDYPGYFRKVFQTCDYINRNWGIYFEIADIYEGFSDCQTGIAMKNAYKAAGE